MQNFTRGLDCKRGFMVPVVKCLSFSLVAFTFWVSLQHTANPKIILHVCWCGWNPKPTCFSTHLHLPVCCAFSRDPSSKADVVKCHFLWDEWKPEKVSYQFKLLIMMSHYSRCFLSKHLPWNHWSVRNATCSNVSPTESGAGGFFFSFLWIYTWIHAFTNNNASV